MSSLEDFMESCGHDITNFNRNFKVLLESIKVSEKKTNNILMNLFTGYDVCSNKVFVKYMARNQEG